MAYGFEILINKFVLGSIGDSVSPSTLTVERIQVFHSGYLFTKPNVTARFYRLPSEAKLAETDSNQSAFMVTLNLFRFGTTAVVEILVRPM